MPNNPKDPCKDGHRLQDGGDYGPFGCLDCDLEFEGITTPPMFTAEENSQQLREQKEKHVERLAEDAVRRFFRTDSEFYDEYYQAARKRFTKILEGGEDED